jgi:hypothetical protein
VDLEVTQVGDGFVVTDVGGRAHHLNHTALFIFECCTGANLATDIAEMMRITYRLPDAPIALVEGCLRDLAADDLIVDPDAATAHSTRPLQIGTDRVVLGRSLGAGRGVFAKEGFESGDLIEHCPVVVLDPADAATVQTTALGHYLFEWHDGRVAVTLGFGSLYNHSAQPNATFHLRFSDFVMEVVAAERIPAGTEIVIDYTGGTGRELGF